MNRYSWSQIKADLEKRRVPQPASDAVSFMKDFRARASLMRQDIPSEQGWAWLPALNWRYGIITVMALFIVGFWVWPTPSTMITQIKSLHVFVPHSGVIILSDEEGQGTVVWVTGLEADDVNKG